MDDGLLYIVAGRDHFQTFRDKREIDIMSNPRKTVILKCTLGDSFELEI